jgi:hypothetical protein
VLAIVDELEHDAEQHPHHNPKAMSPVPTKNLKEWHTPSSRTEVIHELIHGVGGSTRDFNG